MSGELPSAGYSAAPLARKLGLKPGQAAAFVALPPDLQALARAEAFARADRVLTAAELGPEGPYDFVHGFYAEASRLRQDLGCLKAVIRPEGMIWISWPKKAAKVPTDVGEDLIRQEALRTGLVDVKVCAVSDIWSGLKLVIPVKDRPRG